MNRREVMSILFAVLAFINLYGAVFLLDKPSLLNFIVVTLAGGWWAAVYTWFLTLAEENENLKYDEKDRISIAPEK